MGVNRLIFGDEVLFDITDSTVTADKMTSGTIAYGANGNRVTGNLVISSVYSGSTDPAASLGVNGDIYLKV